MRCHKREGDEQQRLGTALKCRAYYYQHAEAEPHAKQHYPIVAIIPRKVGEAANEDGSNEGQSKDQ